MTGWVVLKLAKRTARKKAKEAKAAAPHALDAAVRRPKTLAAVLLGAGAGLAALLRRRRGGNDAGGEGEA